MALHSYDLLPLTGNDLYFVTANFEAIYHAKDQHVSITGFYFHFTLATSLCIVKDRAVVEVPISIPQEGEKIE